MVSKNVIALDAANFKSEVLESSVPVLVDFWAEWCGPCRRIAPLVDELAGEYEGKLRVGKVNVDEAQELAGEYGVMGIPTLVIFKDGRPVERLVGLQSKDTLTKKLDEALETS